MKNKIIWGIYIIVIIFIVIYFWKISPSKEKEDINAEAPFGLYKDMITMIRRDNYFFDYKITKDEDVYIYFGQRDKDKYLEEIYINNEQATISDLLDKINKNLIEPNYIFDLLEDEDYELDKNDETRKFTYKTKIDNEDATIIVTTELASIYTIEILLDSSEYILHYENVGFTNIN